MVTLPGSFAAVGWLAGTALLLVAGAAAAASLWLLDWACGAVTDKGRENGGRHGGTTAAVIEVADATASYAGLVAHVLGRPGSLALEALTLAYCLGQIVAYLGAIGGQVVALRTLVVDVDDEEDGSSSGIHGDIIGIVALGVILPLSLLPAGSSMRFAGVLGTICMVWIATTIVLGDGGGALRRGGLCSLAAPAGVGGDGDDPIEPEALAAGLVVLLQNAPIFLFSMNTSVTYVPVRYQHQTCLGHLVSALAESPPLSTTFDPSRESRMVIARSVIVAMCFYWVCCGVTYAAYCGGVPENVVDVWPAAWIPGSLARVFLVVELVVAAAGIYVPIGRAALWHLVYGPHHDPDEDRRTRVLWTLVLVGGGALGSFLLGGALALPLAVTSALCVTAQVFVLPGLCVAVLIPRRPSADSIGGGSGHSMSSGSGHSIGSGGSGHSVRSPGMGIGPRRYYQRYLSWNPATNAPRRYPSAPTERSDTIPGGRPAALGFAALGGLLGVLSLAALFGLLGR